jgi:hypothetical protein
MPAIIKYINQSAGDAIRVDDYPKDDNSPQGPLIAVQQGQRFFTLQIDMIVPRTSTPTFQHDLLEVQKVMHQLVADVTKRSVEKETMQ